jgi:hypothetical protein
MCVCCTLLVLLVLVVVIELWACLQYIVVIKKLVKFFSTMNFVVIMGVLAMFTWSTLSLGTSYSLFFLLFCGHLGLLMFVFPFHLFLVVKFCILESFGIFRTPSIYGVWILEIIICLCMCSVATFDLGLVRIFTTYQHFLEHTCWYKPTFDGLTILVEYMFTTILTMDPISSSRCSLVSNMAFQIYMQTWLYNGTICTNHASCMLKLHFMSSIQESRIIYYLN